MLGQTRGLVLTLLSLVLMLGWSSPSFAYQDVPDGMQQDLGGLMGDDDGMDSPQGKRAATKKKGARVRKGSTKATSKPRAKVEPTEEAPAAAKVAATATGPRFSKDVAPLLVGLCTGCHEPKQLRGKLDITTFEKLMTGTPAEKVVVPGKPEESHLVLRMKGEETPKMPPGGQRTVGEAAIEKIEQWIKAGALLDAGLDPKALISSYAASAEDIKKLELAKLPTDERDKKTIETGMGRWKKASPKTTPEVSTGKHFILFANMPKDRAASALKTLETQFSTLTTWFGPVALESPEKVSVYVFNDGGSFGEFVRGVEQREFEATETGTARLNIAEPYLAVVDPSGGREEIKQAASKKGGKPKRDEAGDGDGRARSLPGLLTEQFAIGTAYKAGAAPRWVALGVGAYLASKVDSRSPYVSRLRTDAHELMEQGWASKANDALGDATKVEDVRAIGFSIIDWLVSVDKDLAIQFVQGMLKGQDKLDQVIAEVLDGGRADFLGGSAEYIDTNYGSSR